MSLFTYLIVNRFVLSRIVLITWKTFPLLILLEGFVKFPSCFLAFISWRHFPDQELLQVFYSRDLCRSQLNQTYDQ